MKTYNTRKHMFETEKKNYYKYGIGIRLARKRETEEVKQCERDKKAKPSHSLTRSQKSQLYTTPTKIVYYKEMYKHCEIRHDRNHFSCLCCIQQYGFGK